MKMFTFNAGLAELMSRWTSFELVCFDGETWVCRSMASEVIASDEPVRFFAGKTPTEAIHSACESENIKIVL